MTKAEPRRAVRPKTGTDRRPDRSGHDAQSLPMIAASAVLIALVALDTGAPPEATDNSAESRGRVLFQKAETNYNLGKFEAARADYQASYDVDPHPALLFDIGQCYRNMGDYERAQFFYRRYTMVAPTSPNRPAVERLIAEMERLAEEREAREHPASAAGNPAPGAPGAAPVLAAGGAVGSGRPAEHAGAQLLQSPAEQARSAPPRPLYRRAWFWGGVGAVVVAGVAAAVVLSHNGPSGTLPPIDARSPGAAP